MAREKVFSLTSKDFEWETFRAGGSGGQNQNKRNTGVRCRHRVSGAVGEARDYRTQKLNKRAAFRRMYDSKEFQSWCRTMALKLPSIEQIVDDQMQEKNLKVEYL